MKKTNRTIVDVADLIRNKGFHRILKGYVSYMIPHRSDVRCELNTNGESYTNGSTVVVGLDTWAFNFTEAEMLLLVQALAIHECQHVNSSSFTLFKKLIKNSQKHFEKKFPHVPAQIASTVGQYIGNGTEDGRIEWISVNKRPGTKKPLMFLRGHWWKTQPVQGNELNDLLFAMVTYSTMGIMPKNWDESYQSERNHEEIEKIKPLLMKASRAVNSVKHYEACMEILESIAPYIATLVEEMKAMGIPGPESFPNDFTDTNGEESGEETYEESTHFAKTEGKEETDGEEKEEGTGDSPKEQVESQSESLDSTSGMRTKKPEEKKSEMTDEEAVDQALGETKDAVEKATEQLEQEKKRQEKEAKEELVELSELSADEIKKIKAESNCELKEIVTVRQEPLKYTPRSLPQQLKRDGSKLRKEIQGIFENKKAYTHRHQKRGVVDASSLWKIGTNETNIFVKKTASRETDFASFLLCDASGSMRGRVYKTSGEAVAIVEEALKGLIPFKVMQFDTSRSDNVRHTVIKDFNEVKPGNYTHSHYTNSEAGGGNLDGVSIRCATIELLNRPEKEKILFVFSDGEPAYINNREGIEDTREAVKEARKKGIFVVSIYFEKRKEIREKKAKVFEYMYGSNSINCEPEEISRHLSRTLKKILKNK